ncbi:TetR/AcrR family transcriptional regulator [Frondihabitans australicus]|uniref:TetR family transcriptional regulator n=1 Tax=Frondihabitans australicus TaxID=386892 RepID=A0A495IAC0_9MICO|nr:TetR/AcrR family transcriptional regulator [Frondihabitans australicus]RKR72959.1 TetR family transcriptional regulator [Frondihabitans australicus]
MTSTDLPSGTTGRLSAADRREQILAAATVVFGENGYAGATTDQVAQAAGISQPYVVRMFGTKQKLFLEVMNGALGALLERFRAALPDPGDGTILEKRLGAAYIDLVDRAGVHRTLLQAFVSGNDPVIGDAAREGFVSIYRFLRDEAHFEPAQVSEFLGYGMLLSVLLGIELPRTFGKSADADELMLAAFGEKCREVLDVAGPSARRV